MGLGQKLEDARNRKGISIREATESTKIRSDYLSSFEAGDFNINLPEVYLRGFVRLYAHYLGLDHDAIVADLEVELGTSSQNQRKSLGSITSNEMSDTKDSSPSTTKNSLRSANRAVIPKVVLAVAAVIILLVPILILVISNNSDSEVMVAEENKDLTIAEKKTDISEVSAQGILLNNELKLATIGPIERLIICDEGETPKKYHEFSNLPIGWEKAIEFKNSFRCYSSSLENLRFAVDDGPEKKAEGTGAGNFSWTK